MIVSLNEAEVVELDGGLGIDEGVVVGGLVGLLAFAELELEKSSCDELSHQTVMK